MTQSNTELIQISHPEGQNHQLKIIFTVEPASAQIVAMYESGSAQLAEGTEIASWSAFYEPPNKFDKGHFALGDLGIDIKIETFRGIGLGSLLMLPLVRWGKSLPGDVPVASIPLQGSDASTDGNRDRRNKFYEKLGFVFDYKDQDKTYGCSKETPVSKLVEPKFKMSNGWEVVSLQSKGSVF